MIKLHVTKKLLAKIPLNKQGNIAGNKNVSVSSSALTDNPLSGWHANLITLQRRNCILMVHDSTRFPLFIPCLVKPDFANLNGHFEDAFMNTLLKLGANQQQLDTAVSLLDELCIDSVCDRSVQGTMNRMKGDIEHMMWYDNAGVTELSGYKVGAWLADRPCNIKAQKACIWPQQAMLSLLNGAEYVALAPAVQSAAMPDNVVHLKNYVDKR